MIFSSLRKVALGAVLAAAFGFVTSTAYAVDVNGRIRGIVTDPSGAVVPSTVVTATNEQTGVKTTTKTQADGSYIFQALPVGTYDISVATPGFQAFLAKGIVINIDTEYVETVKLAVGESTTVLEVAASAVQVNTTDMQLDNVVTAAQMEELPLIGRGFTALETILPGVQASSDRFGSYSVSGAETQQSSYLINGADTNDIALNTVTFSPNLDAIDQFNLIDGPLNAEYDRNSGGIVSATIKQGSNHFHGDAFEFYRDTFLNTPNFFAITCTSATSGNCTKTLPPYHQNIFGGTIGGPILKDKLFFFGAYQGIRQFTGTTGNSNVFNNAQRGGNFSTDVVPTCTSTSVSANPLGYNICGNNTNTIPLTITSLAATNPLCNPGTTAAPTNNTWGPCLLALNGSVPSTAFNPLAAKLLSYFPTATSGNSYVFNSTVRSSTDQGIGRFDFSPNAKNQITALVLYQQFNDADNIPFTGANVPGFGQTDATHVYQYTADWTYQLSPTMVNDLALHYTRFNYQAVIPANNTTPQSLGFAINPENTAGQSFPLIATGYGTIGFSTNGPQPRIDQVYQVDDNLSKSLGHHQLKAGYDGRKFEVSNPFSANNNGAYSYSSSSAYSTGDPGLDYLLGIPSSYSQGSGATIQANAYLNYLYAQDSWKATDSLTISYGLGYQIDTTLHNRQYGGEAIPCFYPGQKSKIFPTAPVGVNYPGDPGCTDSGSAYTRFGDLGPRIGFAYAPNLGFISGGDAKKFAIRGGFGIYYDRTEEETSLNNLETAPYGLSSSGAVDYGAQAPAFQNPYQDVGTGQVYANKFPYTFPTPGQTIDYSVFEPLGLNTYGHGFRSPYAENFQLSVEREFAARTIARLTYVGSLGHHNQIAYEGNPITTAGHNACLADTTYCGSLKTQGYRNLQDYYFSSHTQYGIVDPATGIPAFPTFGIVDSEGASNYNSLQASIDKGLTHGLQFQLSYTYSHSLDNASSYENSGYGGSTRGYNQYVPALNYGNSTFDARQRLVFSPIYIVPFKGTGSTFSLSNLALSGWQVSAIVSVATGFPFDISYGGGSPNSLYCSPSFTFYACPDEPNLVGGLVKLNPRNRVTSTSGNFIDRTTYFQSAGLVGAAPLGSFGNAARDEFHGPGINNTNLILAKNFALSADGVRRLQIRMESDNVFNHTQFSNPASTVSTSANGTNVPSLSLGTFGQVSSAAAARLTQLAAKIYF